MTSKEIKEMILRGEDITYNGRTMTLEDLHEMLARAEMQEFKKSYIVPGTRGGLMEEISKSATGAWYDELTKEKMETFIKELDAFKFDREKELIYGTPGHKYPRTMGEAFAEGGPVTVRSGIQIDLRDVPYDMEPEDYCQRVWDAIQEHEMVVPSSHRIPVIVRLDENGRVIQKS